MPYIFLTQESQRVTSGAPFATRVVRRHAAPGWNRSQGQGNVRTRPIELVQTGDLVCAFDLVQMKRTGGRVKRLFARESRPVVEVVLKVGGVKETIVATLDHPFWVQGIGWVPAKELRSGAVLKGRSDESPSPIVECVRDLKESRDVFNFEVEGVHNYLVGKQGVLVHNESYLPGSGRSESSFADIRAQVDQQSGDWSAIDRLPVVDKLTYKVPFHEPPKRYVPFNRDQLRFNQNGYGYFGEVTFDKKFSANIGSIDFKENGFELTLYGAIDGVAGAQAKPTDFSVTRAFLEFGVSAYAKHYGRMPESLGGTLAWKNREMFYQEFVLAREMNPGFSATQVASVAFQRIPFGAHRVPLGYSRFGFEKLRYEDVSDVRGRTYTVPIPRDIVVKRENPGFVEDDMLADTLPPSTDPLSPR